MNHLDDRGKVVVLGASIAAGSSREEKQRGPESFSASADDVIGNVANEDDFGMKRLAQYGVDFAQVVAQDRLKQRDRHEGGESVRNNADFRAPGRRKTF